MKVAIAGTGNVARYLIEELTSGGHHVVILTRKAKPDLEAYAQRETDYSISSLVEVLDDREALVSTVADYSDLTNTTKIHSAMLEALKHTKTCKTFIPSEWTLNVEDHPEHPMFLAEDQAELHAQLRATKDIRWTIMITGWLMEYVLPSNQRHLKDIGEAFPANHATKTFTIYGPGTQKVDFTSVRDVAKAVSTMLHQPQNQPWAEHTYISGDQLTWNELFATLKTHDSSWTSTTKPLVDTVRQISHPDKATAMLAMFEIQSYAGASHWPRERTLRDRDKYFQGVHFRTVDQLLEAAEQRPEEII
jgi:swainsonine biosynthesis oxidoreductase SwnR